MKKIEIFKVEDDKINRVRKHCPKCGPGVFIAEHKNRFSCGKCGYTEFKGGGRKEQKTKLEEKSLEQKPVEEKIKHTEKETPKQPVDDITSERVSETVEEKKELHTHEKEKQITKESEEKSEK
jgi:small subunit ribosomal protein S27Ae